MRANAPWEVWYYQTKRGESPVEEFYRSLPLKALTKCLSYVDALEETGFGLPASFIKKIGGDLWELRPEYGGVEYRLFYFTLVQGRLVIVHAVSKKTQRTRPRDIDLANGRIRDIRKRMEEIEKNASSELQVTPPIRRRAVRG